MKKFADRFSELEIHCDRIRLVKDDPQGVTVIITVHRKLLFFNDAGEVAGENHNNWFEVAVSSFGVVSSRTDKLIAAHDLRRTIFIHILTEEDFKNFRYGL